MIADLIREYAYTEKRVAECAEEYEEISSADFKSKKAKDEAEYKKIMPPELQTRFDLVCEFEKPTSIEKIQFLDLLLEKAYEKYPDQFATIQMSEDDKRELYNFDYSGLSALRDIKRVFNNRLMDFFTRKRV